MMVEGSIVIVTDGAVTTIQLFLARDNTLVYEWDVSSRATWTIVEALNRALSYAFDSGISVGSITRNST